MTPTIPNREIRVGDCRALLRELPDDSVNCVVTSPPYWGLRDYGTGTWDGGDSACPHAFKAGGTARSTLDQYDNGLTQETIEAKVLERGHATYLDLCKRCGARRIDDQIGLERTPTDYVSTISAVFAQVRRVLRSDGTLWINLGDSYVGGNRGGIGDRSTLEGGAANQNESRLAQDKRGGRGQRLANGRGDSPAILRNKFPGTAGHVTAGVPGMRPKNMVGIPWRVAFALQDAGWYLRSDIIWAKPNPMPESVTDRPTKAHEYLFLLTKTDRYHYDGDAIREPLADKTRTAFGTKPQSKGTDTLGLVKSDNWAKSVPVRKPRLNEDGSEAGANKRSVWTVATHGYDGAHFATFPPKLIEPCILAGCPAGGMVLDPFGGSGTVGEVAEALGRRWMLLELNPAYADLARARTAQRGLFGDAAAAALVSGGGA